MSNANLEFGQSTQLSATSLNSGDSPSTSTTIRYYRSTDSTIDTSDLQIYDRVVPALLASATMPFSTTLSTPAAGTYWVGACVVPLSAESDKSNNCSVGVEMDVE